MSYFIFHLFGMYSCAGAVLPDIFCRGRGRSKIFIFIFYTRLRIFRGAWAPLLPLKWVLSLWLYLCGNDTSKIKTEIVSYSVKFLLPVFAFMSGLHSPFPSVPSVVKYKQEQTRWLQYLNKFIAIIFHFLCSVYLSQIKHQIFESVHTYFVQYLIFFFLLFVVGCITTPYYIKSGKGQLHSNTFPDYCHILHLPKIEQVIEEKKIRRVPRDGQRITY